MNTYLLNVSENPVCLWVKFGLCCSMSTFVPASFHCLWGDACYFQFLLFPLPRSETNHNPNLITSPIANSNPIPNPNPIPKQQQSERLLISFVYQLQHALSLTLFRDLVTV